MSKQLQKRSQASTDYLMLGAILLVLILPLMFYSAQTVDVRSVTLSEGMKTLQEAMKEIHDLGHGSQKRVIVQIPKGVQTSSVNWDSTNLVTEVRMLMSEQDISFNLPFQVHGQMPIDEGRHYLNVMNDQLVVVLAECGDNSIQLGEQCDGTQIPNGCNSCSSDCLCECSSGDPTCPTTLVCDSTAGVCLPCSSKLACPPDSTGATQVCIFGQCVSQCPCTPQLVALGYTCNNGVCTPPPGTLSRCSTVNPCPNNNVCVNGICLPTVPICNNGIVEPGEVCDPPGSVCNVLGSAGGGSGATGTCSADCQTCTTLGSTTCGDGIQATHEDCDPGLGGLLADCTDNTGALSGVIGKCGIETNCQCRFIMCSGSQAIGQSVSPVGDGVANLPYEQCGEPGLLHCAASNICTDCQCQTTCGNGNAEPWEQCGDPGTLGCGPFSTCQDCMCTTTPLLPQTSCGDGITQPYEQCGEPGLSCSGNELCIDCQCQLFQSNTCGNSVIEGTEQCDGYNLNGESCATVTSSTPPYILKPLGQLVCDNSCQFDTSDCYIPECMDNTDNDSDSWIDYPADPMCMSFIDNDESGEGLCGNGIVEASEQCDPGNPQSAACPAFYACDPLHCYCRGWFATPGHMFITQQLPPPIPPPPPIFQVTPTPCADQNAASGGPIMCGGTCPLTSAGAVQECVMNPMTINCECHEPGWNPFGLGPVFPSGGSGPSTTTSTPYDPEDPCIDSALTPGTTPPIGHIPVCGGTCVDETQICVRQGLSCNCVDQSPTGLQPSRGGEPGTSLD